MLIEEKILDNIGKIGQINIEKAKNMGRKFFIGRICITDGLDVWDTRRNLQN